MIELRLFSSYQVNMTKKRLMFLARINKCKQKPYQERPWCQGKTTVTVSRYVYFTQIISCHFISNTKSYQLQLWGKMTFSTFFQGGYKNSFAYLDIDNVFMTSTHKKIFISGTFKTVKVDRNIKTLNVLFFIYR